MKMRTSAVVSYRRRLYETPSGVRTLGWRIASIILCYAVFEATALLIRRNISFWGYDSGDYWIRGQMLNDTCFDLSSITPVRGYVFPVFLAVFSVIGCGSRRYWYLLSPMLISLWTVLILPGFRVGEKGFTRSTALGCISFSVLLCVLFSGLVGFPLSDLPALISMSLAVLCLKVAAEKTSVSGTGGLCLIAGLFSYFAYNIRTIYLFAGIAALALFLVENTLSSNQVKEVICRCLLGASAFAFGAVLASLPQVYANYRCYGIISLKVPTDNLMLRQIEWGFSYMRYDTFVGASESHPKPEVRFMSPLSETVLAEARFGTWGDFFRFFFRHPLEVLVIYALHALNYLFPCWPQLYITDLDSCKWPYGIAGFTVLFMAVATVPLKVARRKKDALFFIPLVVPALLIIPGAVEYRFSVAVYALALYQLCFNMDWETVKAIPSGNRKRILLSYLLTGAIVFTVWVYMLSTEYLTALRM